MTRDVGRHALADPLMWPALVEVSPVLSKQRPELFVTQEHHVVLKLASGAAHEPLRDRIHVRRTYCDLGHPSACAFRDVVETQAELVVAVAKQIRVSLSASPFVRSM